MSLSRDGELKEILLEHVKKLERSIIELENAYKQPYGHNNIEDAPISVLEPINIEKAVTENLLKQINPHNLNHFYTAFGKNEAKLTPRVDAKIHQLFPMLETNPYYQVEKLSILLESYSSYLHEEIKNEKKNSGFKPDAFIEAMPLHKTLGTFNKKEKLIEELQQTLTEDKVAEVKINNFKQVYQDQPDMNIFKNQKGLLSFLFKSKDEKLITDINKILTETPEYKSDLSPRG